MARKRVTPLPPILSGLRQTRMIRASLFVDAPETTISMGFDKNQGHRLEIHPAARHVSQKIALCIRESSHDLDINVDARFQVSRREAQLGQTARLPGETASNGG